VAPIEASTSAFCFNIFASGFLLRTA